jgi:hypothetical protein
MLPFRKKDDDGLGQAVIPKIERKSDDEGSYDMLDAVAEDLLLALEKKDKGMIKAALQSLCDHIQDMDAEQDEGAI